MLQGFTAPNLGEIAKFADEASKKLFAKTHEVCTKQEVVTKRGSVNARNRDIDPTTKTTICKQHATIVDEEFDGYSEAVTLNKTATKAMNHLTVICQNFDLNPPVHVPL
jgi:hypothetical protein